MTNIISTKITSLALPPYEVSMQLRYGVNGKNNWRSLALGSHRELLLSQLREMGTRVVRIFIDNPTPDDAMAWQTFASDVQAVLDISATPMVTFAKLPMPCDSNAVRSFADGCGDIVKRSVNQWGGEAVRKWYWCVGNDSNSEWVSGGLTFEEYRQLYEKVAQGVLQYVSPYLRGNKPLIGGPAVDGFQPFWIDWVWRFVNEIDNSLIGFVSWHRYGDWREPGQWGAPGDETVFRALLMARSAEYERHASAVGRVLKGRNILNICAELNAHSHHEARVSQQLNETVFGATYYASALVHLTRGGADVEMFRISTDSNRYGILDKTAAATPVFHAKSLIANYLRYGDRISFADCTEGKSGVDVLLARGADDRKSALFVHTKDEVMTCSLSGLNGDLRNYTTVFKIDKGTGSRVAEETFDGTITFNGYGVAVVTSAAPVGVTQW